MKCKVFRQIIYKVGETMKGCFVGVLAYMEHGECILPCQWMNSNEFSKWRWCEELSYTCDSVNLSCSITQHSLRCLFYPDGFFLWDLRKKTSCCRRCGQRLHRVKCNLGSRGRASVHAGQGREERVQLQFLKWMPQVDHSEERRTEDRQANKLTP